MLEYDDGLDDKKITNVDKNKITCSIVVVPYTWINHDIFEKWFFKKKLIVSEMKEDG